MIWYNFSDNWSIVVYINDYNKYECMSKFFLFWGFFVGSFDC